MKNFIKITLASLILLFTTTTLNAQLLPISMGVKGGVNFSSANGEPAKYKTGFNAGLTVDLNLPAGIAIMSGLELTTKGTKFEDTDISVNAMYLQLPIHLGYRFGVPGVKFHFNLGPYFAHGVGGKVKNSYLGEKVSTFDYYDKFDWGLGIGVGVTLLGKIQIRAGYDHGLKNIASKFNKAEGENADFKNRNLYVSAGLLFF